LFGLLTALRDPVVEEAAAGKTVRLHMDSRCAIRNLIKGGGPVPSLVSLTKEVWLKTRELQMHLPPVWLRRSEDMMVLVDALSKEGGHAMAAVCPL